MADEEQGLVRPETLFSFDTEYSADSCEYNPELGILATGTYQVQPGAGYSSYWNISGTTRSWVF